MKADWCGAFDMVGLICGASVWVRWWWGGEWVARVRYLVILGHDLGLARSPMGSSCVVRPVTLLVAFVVEWSLQIIVLYIASFTALVREGGSMR